MYLEVVEAMEDTAAEDLEDYEDELFDADEISNIVKFAVETTLSTCEYENTKVENCRYLNIIHMCCCQVGHWVNSIVETKNGNIMSGQCLLKGFAGLYAI